VTSASSPPSNENGKGDEEVFWVKFDNFDPVEISISPTTSIAEFKKVLKNHEQFERDLVNFGLKDISLFVLRNEREERTDVRKKLADYQISETDLILIKIMI